MKTEHLVPFSFSVALFIVVFEGFMNTYKFFFGKSLRVILFLHYRQKPMGGLELLPNSVMVVFSLQRNRGIGETEGAFRGLEANVPSEHSPLAVP